MSINRAKRFRIFIRDSFTCQYCGLQAPAVQLHVDHKNPIANGGSDEESNLVTACIACNSGKSATLLPIDLEYEDGPLRGRILRTTERAPLVWVWSAPDGAFVEILDAMVETTPGNGVFRKVRYGPSFLETDRPGWKPIADQLSYRQQTGEFSELLGAYMASDEYPFVHYQRMTWMEPWRVLLDFDFNDARST